MKKKFLIIMIAVFIFAITSIVIVIKLNSKVTFKDLEYVFEYGELIEFNKENIIYANEKIMNSVTIDESSVIYENGNNYPEVGEYRLILSYKQIGKIKTREVLVKIEDTISPEFTKFKDKYEIIVGNKIDYKKEYEAKDLSEVTVIVEDSRVDYNKVGEYKITITAEDVYENKIVKEANVKIIAKKEVNNNTSSKKASNNSTSKNNTSKTVSCSSVTEPYKVNGIIIANKKHPLPCNYAPGENSVAAKALKSLIADMKALNMNVSNSYSGYRSYDTQKRIYNNYVSQYGQIQADTFSARPGYSEHQTGLAFDLRNSNGTLLDTATESKWVASNAYKYGFIVRYLKSKQSITGYVEEPWHLRYIGDEAEAIYKSGKTLEEYLNITGGDYN